MSPATLPSSVISISAMFAPTLVPIHLTLTTSLPLAPWTHSGGTLLPQNRLSNMAHFASLISLNLLRSALHFTLIFAMPTPPIFSALRFIHKRERFFSVLQPKLCCAFSGNSEHSATAC